MLVFFPLILYDSKGILVRDDSSTVREASRLSLSILEGWGVCFDDDNDCVCCLKFS